MAGRRRYASSKSRQRGEVLARHPTLTWADIERLSDAEQRDELMDRIACLDERERTFVNLLLDPGDTRSPRRKAIAAGWTGAEATKHATRLIEDPNVRTIRLLAASLNRVQAPLAPERVLQELQSIAFADVTDLIEPEIGKNGEPIAGSGRFALEKATPAQRAALDFSVVLGPDGTTVQEVRFRQRDKMAALDRLAKHFGLYGEGVERDGDLQARLAEAATRLLEGASGVRPGLYAAAQERHRQIEQQRDVTPRFDATEAPEEEQRNVGAEGRAHHPVPRSDEPAPAPSCRQRALGGEPVPSPSADTNGPPALSPVLFGEVVDDE